MKIIQSENCNYSERYQNKKMKHILGNEKKLEKNLSALLILSKGWKLKYKKLFPFELQHMKLTSNPHWYNT